MVRVCAFLYDVITPPWGSRISIMSLSFSLGLVVALPLSFMSLSLCIGRVVDHPYVARSETSSSPAAPEPAEVDVDGLELGETLRQAEVLGSSHAHRGALHAGKLEGASACARSFLVRLCRRAGSRGSVGEGILGRRPDQSRAGPPGGELVDVAECAAVLQLVAEPGAREEVADLHLRGPLSRLLHCECASEV